MKRIAELTALAAALGAATLAFGQALNQTAPQPTQAPPSHSTETPQPPSQNDSSMTTVQQPISGNSTATSPKNSMAPNSSESSTRLAAIVPEGMSPKTACDGFKTTNLCAATLHAAKNLNVSFRQLKEKVTGGQRLQAAIEQLKPGADAKSEVRKAEQQAHNDLHTSQG
jgi:hypothetical protein